MIQQADILERIRTLQKLCDGKPHAERVSVLLPVLDMDAITFDENNGKPPTLTITEMSMLAEVDGIGPDVTEIIALDWRCWAQLLRVIALKLIEVKPALFTTELETILMAARLAGLSINLPEIPSCQQHLSGIAAGAALGLQRRDKYKPSSSKLPATQP